MAKVGNNKAVFFTYTVTDEAGNILEQVGLPVGYIHGLESGLLEKVENALVGHEAGEILDITIRPEDGFGARDPDLVIVDAVENVPAEYREIGAEAQFQNENGDKKTFVVTDVSDGKVTLDGNHPYAGKTRIFIVTITEVRDATPDEINSGSPEELPRTVH